MKGVPRCDEAGVLHPGPATAGYAAVGVDVIVGVGLTAGVGVIVGVDVIVGVRVTAGGGVIVGVNVIVGVRVTAAVGVIVGVDVIVGVGVTAGGGVIVGVNVIVGVGVTAGGAAVRRGAVSGAAGEACCVETRFGYNKMVTMANKTPRPAKKWQTVPSLKHLSLPFCVNGFPLTIRFMSTESLPPKPAGDAMGAERQFLVVSFQFSGSVDILGRLVNKNGKPAGLSGMFFA